MKKAWRTFWILRQKGCRNKPLYFFAEVMNPMWKWLSLPSMALLLGLLWVTAAPAAGLRAGAAKATITPDVPKAEWDEQPPWLQNRKERWYGEIKSVGPEIAGAVTRAIVGLIEGSD
jgi:hypothetical protein